MRLLVFLAWIVLVVSPTSAAAEDGHELWLRYRPVEDRWSQHYGAIARAIVAESQGERAKAARGELQRGLAGLLGRSVPLSSSPDDGSILLGTPKSSSQIARLSLPLSGLGREGYLIRSQLVEGKRVTLIAANDEVGLIYGVFDLLRRIQTRQPIDRLDVTSAPRLQLRLLNHWDNLDRSVERGYAGQSIWDWHKLPGWNDSRYTDYARANASIGINGTVLTNVNASAEVLGDTYLRKVAALADTFRPWGIRVYLTARFSAPIEIGGLKTADPLEPAVRAWWRAKASEIYRHVPDFGGFLVKANSEGQPGPQDYGRTHVDGANMLAEAVAPHGGSVIWRAFVYQAKAGQDRAKQAYDEFQPFDGQFRPNVILQVKNGPIDFQPREPFHPLFGRMPRTPLMLEAQITKEYLGFATHLAYLGSMWKEVLDADTCLPRCGSPVSATLRGMAGVANIGSDRNWSGSHFDQANWYAFGRLAWAPAGSARSIAEEWTRQTWGNDRELVEPIVAMMLGSREAVVNYMTPLGLHHLMGTGHHYGPAPWVDNLEREDWNPVYYHCANADGIGFDRTSTGSNAIAQYAPPVALRFGSLKTVPEEYLLWFHRVPWDHRLKSGQTLWRELLGRYDHGVAEVEKMQLNWQRLASRIDPERHQQVAAFLAIQHAEARWWRDASIAFWLSVSGRPLPPQTRPPEHALDHYKALRFPHAPGQAR